MICAAVKTGVSHKQPMKSTGPWCRGCDERHRRAADGSNIFSGKGQENLEGLSRMLGNLHHLQESTNSMNSTHRINSMKGVERLISQQWPKLKKRAQTENNLEELIAILEEIDDLLSNLEMRIAVGNRNVPSRANAVSTAGFSVCHVLPDDSEGEFDE
jgi:hypothetical protein